MKHSLLFLLLLISSQLDAQNASYCIINNEIYPALDSNYQYAKTRFLEVENDHRIDPSWELYFLEHSLINKDIDFFKDRIQSLIKLNGYRFTRTDTLRYRQNELHDLIFENQLEDWLLSKSDSLFPLWIAKNPKAYELSQRLEKLRILDQTRGNYYRIYDTCSLSREYLQRIDYENFANLIMICKENNDKVPSTFDIGFGSAWNLILLHNLRKENMFDIWNMTLPYIEKAYFEGSISESYFRLFDQLLVRQTGYQYYGFEGDKPIWEEEYVKERKSRYNFCY